MSVNITEPKTISLLYPEDFNPTMDKVIREDDAIVKDLDLGKITNIMRTSTSNTNMLRVFLSLFTDNPSVIQYRLDIFEDLLNNHKLCECFQKLLPLIEQLESFSNSRMALESDLMMQLLRISELELYVESVKQIDAAFSEAGSNLHSEGLCRLRSIIAEIAASQSFISLAQQLPKMIEKIRGIASITIGINLDGQLRPKEAILVSINDAHYKSGSLIDRLLDLDFSNDPYRGISPLQVVMKGSDEYTARENHVLRQAILNSLNKTIRSVVRPIVPMVMRYSKLKASFITALGPEIIFLLGGVKLVREMESYGLTMCKPQVLPKESRICKIDSMYNIGLASNLHSTYSGQKLGEQIVCNFVDFGEKGRIFILTGPNQGGKTTYTQAVGMAQMLFQTGLYVPGQWARMSPVDMIYTHFPVEEKPDSNLGRMGEECSRLSQIFERISRYSLVLLNESLSSTSPGEGVYIAREILLSLKLLEARAIFATHFHELGMNLEATNALVQGDSKITSIVAGIEAIGQTDKTGGDISKRSFKISYGPPQGLSYAKEIASRYGISIEKIKDKLKEPK